ncbi:MAG: cytochrome c-type biogenesis protein, partial [Leptothrix sp. (in: b-proteobacteria)]
MKPTSLRPWLSAAACAAALLGGLAGVPSRAAEAPPLAANPALEARMLAITAELRCLVCQNQTVADSHSDLAGDLRQQVREMLERGASNQEVIDFMTARYGDFVLYRPPVKPTTVLLWAGPALLLFGGVTALILTLRRRSRMPADAFDAEEGDVARPDAPLDTPTAAPVAPV